MSGGHGAVGRHRDLLDLFTELRERAGRPSLRSVAAAASISASYLSEVLNGKNIPSVAVAAAIAGTLGGTAAEQRRAREHAEAAAADRARTLRDRTDHERGSEGSPAVVRSDEPAWWVRSGYVEQVRDIAPGGGRPGALKDRDRELAALADFCAGDEPYLWWLAGPWAGKTALMSTFVLNPPAGVEVVAFFVTARLVAQADSTAFTDALLDQLSAVIGETLPGTLTTPVSRDVHRRALLRAAAEQVNAAGRRLLLVVDGLDEDRGGRAGSGLPSIASLLPKVPDKSLRIVVTGRPNPACPMTCPATIRCEAPPGR
ncbi:helix-turn-helix domain-containing protein [Dactylosporangium sp. NPDC051485]|uniref:helix-turn-helix domain-containing protein n=1 Tax=Dactylosporangium sp. NPDC051485 TaxID=3154846 RepID=UPI00342E7320